MPAAASFPWSAWAADAVLLLHFAFIAFVVAGALLLPRWPHLAWLHLPALAWGVLVEWNGWICPLTPLENALRHAAGQAGYAGGFIARYLLPWIYPAGLTPAIQWWLGMLALALNLAWYGLWWRQWRRRRAHGARPVRPVRH